MPNHLLAVLRVALLLVDDLESVAYGNTKRRFVVVLYIYMYMFAVRAFSFHTVQCSWDGNPLDSSRSTWGLHDTFPIQCTGTIGRLPRPKHYIPFFRISCGRLV